MRKASFWFTSLSSATKMRIGKRLASSASNCLAPVCTAPGVLLRAALGSARINTSNRADCRAGLVNTAANKWSSPVWRRLLDDSSAIGRSERSLRTCSANARPSISGMCRSVISRSNCSPVRNILSASFGDREVRGSMPQRLACRLRMRKLVALSSTNKTRLPFRSSGWLSGATSIAGAACVSMVK